MQILFTNQFVRQIQKIKEKHVARGIEKAIDNVKASASLSDIANVKKLSGSKNTYRIRVGDYRIGIYCEDDIVEFVCFLHRKDIYKFFP